MAYIKSKVNVEHSKTILVLHFSRVSQKTREQQTPLLISAQYSSQAKQEKSLKIIWEFFTETLHRALNLRPFHFIELLFLCGSFR